MTGWIILGYVFLVYGSLLIIFGILEAIMSIIFGVTATNMTKDTPISIFVVLVPGVVGTVISLVIGSVLVHYGRKWTK
jgi:hypothetical protein